MNDIPMRYRPVPYLHTGKHDYDDCFIVKNNATAKRTRRKMKAKRKRILDFFSNIE